MNTLERLKALETEEVRILQEEGLRFIKDSPTQERATQSLAKVVGIAGGNQAGKTTWGCKQTLLVTGRVHPYRPNFPGRVWSRVCVQDFKVLNAVMIPKFKQLVPRKPCLINNMKWCGLRGEKWGSAWSEKDATLYFADDSFIEFRTYEQDIQSHAGAQRHWIWFDEEPPRQINEENAARQTTTGINMIYTFTPLNYSQWIYRSLYQRSATDPDVELFFMPTKENRFVDPETLKFLEQTYTDPAERAARLYGKFTFMEGLVYKEYGEHNLIEPYDIPSDVKYSVVIDPHEAKPTAWNLFGEDKEGRLYVMAEGDEDGDVEHICNEIFAQLDNRRIDLWLCDPSARRSAPIRGHGRMIDEFRRFIPQLIEANNSLDVGISRVRSAVKPLPNIKPMLMVSKSCPTTHHQMKNYSWKPPLKSGENRTKAAVTLRENDHPDNIRYRRMHQPIDGGFQIESFGIEVYGK